MGQYGGLAQELENLKRDKNVLMAELIRLRQQQQVLARRRQAACMLRMMCIAAGQITLSSMHVPKPAITRQGCSAKVCLCIEQLVVHRLRNQHICIPSMPE